MGWAGLMYGHCGVLCGVLLRSRLKCYVHGLMWVVWSCVFWYWALSVSLVGLVVVFYGSTWFPHYQVSASW